jgi:hypothetical protein
LSPKSLRIKDFSGNALGLGCAVTNFRFLVPAIVTITRAINSITPPFGKLVQFFSCDKPGSAQKLGRLDFRMFPQFDCLALPQCGL